MEWLKTADISLLTPIEDTFENDNSDDEDELLELETRIEPAIASEIRQFDLFEDTVDRSAKLSRFYTVEITKEGIIEELKIDLSNKHIIAAYGFEDRSLGAWKNLLSVNKPINVTMLEYPCEGNKREIRELLERGGINYNEVYTKSVIQPEEAFGIIESCEGREIIIDVTSLSKALIYSLTLSALKKNKEVWVLHTCADRYYPSEEDLGRALELLDKEEYVEACRQLDIMIPGEKGDYIFTKIGKSERQSNTPIVFVSLISLKLSRILKMLEYLGEGVIEVVAPLHSGGKESNRSKVAEHLAKYLIRNNGGKYEMIGSLDPKKAYEYLMGIYEKYLLSGYNIEILLGGVKMHIIGAAMLAATVAPPTGVYYNEPEEYDPKKYTRGTAETRLFNLKIIEVGSKGKGVNEEG